MDLLAAIASLPPEISTADVRTLLSEQYQLDGELQALVSERDQNVRVTTASGQRFVLKIANATEDPVVTDFQIQALLHISAGDVPVNTPAIVPTLDGRLSSTVMAGDVDYMARVVTYLPGIPLNDVATEIALVEDLGTCLANLGVALRDFGHAGDQQVLLWDMQRASGLRSITQHVSDLKLRDEINRCLDEFEGNALPAFDSLRNQVIHGDANPGNVLADANNLGRIAGIIDFGDMLRAPLIVDVAIAASYLRRYDDVLGFIAPFIAAYNRVTPLQPPEINLLYDLIRTRLVTTISILQWRLAERGEGDIYSQESMHSEREAERFFLALTACPKKQFTAQIERACGR